MELAKRVRSRIRAWAASALSQRVGSSTRAFSSSSLRSAGSQSKTPPEQFDRLLDVGLGGLDIQSHGTIPNRVGAPNSLTRLVIQAVDLVLLRRRLGRRWWRIDRGGGVGRPGEAVLEDIVVGLRAHRVGLVGDLRLGARLEGLSDAVDDGVARIRGPLEVVGREVLVRLLHEVDEGRQRRAGALLAFAQAAVVVEADVGADHDV